MKFEYLVARGVLAGVKDDTIFAPTINGQKSPEWQNKPLQDFLNHYGAEGWDLVNVFSPRAGDGFCVVLKRAVQ